MFSDGEAEKKNLEIDWAMKNKKKTISNIGDSTSSKL